MVVRKRPRGRAAALAALLAVGGLAGCATIPTSGDVEQGQGGVVGAGDAAALPIGPREGAQPDQVVRGFLNAAAAGPTTRQQFSTAKEFLAAGAAADWDPTASVSVFRTLTYEAPDPSDADLTATAVARASVVATVDADGVYREEPAPVEVEAEFGLVREPAGEWRISSLPDGMFVQDASFSYGFHATSLYFPTADHRHWVPDQRWFPRNGWRAEAVRQILAGPPEWLAGAVVATVPDDTDLDVSAVPVNQETGQAEVRLTAPLGQMPADQRALLAAQLSATLADGPVPQPVTLYADSVEQTVPDVDLPAMPSTASGPLVLVDDVVSTVVDRRLDPFPHELDWSDVADPTALAVGPATSPVVVRDGTDRIVQLSGDARVLATGSDLAAPSVDRFGTVWTSGGPGTLQAVADDGTVHSLAPEWIAGRAVTGLRVSPEGARVAIVSVGPAGAQIDVAGIVRGNDGVPALSPTALRVGATVPDAREVQWSGHTTLVTLTRDVAGETALWAVGVGGLEATSDGTSQERHGVAGPRQVAAGDNALGTYAINEAGTLVARQASGQWTRVQDGVRLVAFRG